MAAAGRARCGGRCARSVRSWRRRHAGRGDGGSACTASLAGRWRGARARRPRSMSRTDLARTHAATRDGGRNPRRRLARPTVGLRPPSGRPNRPSYVSRTGQLCCRRTAGIARVPIGTRRRRSGLPRQRGDRPYLRDVMWDAIGAPPPARGSPPAAALRARDAAGSPARAGIAPCSFAHCGQMRWLAVCAGIAPTSATSAAPRRRLPRLRGDRPQSAKSSAVSLPQSHDPADRRMLLRHLARSQPS